MEKGVEPLPLKKSVNFSLQIINTILTIIKLFINFHESDKYNILVIIDSIFNFIILIDVNIIPFLVGKVSNDTAIKFGIILAFIWALNVMSGLMIIHLLISKDLLGINYFIIFGRILLIWGFAGTSGIDSD